MVQYVRLVSISYMVHTTSHMVHTTSSMVHTGSYMVQAFPASFGTHSIYDIVLHRWLSSDIRWTPLHKELIQLQSQIYCTNQSPKFTLQLRNSHKCHPMIRNTVAKRMTEQSINTHCDNIWHFHNPVYPVTQPTSLIPGLGYVGYIVSNDIRSTNWIKRSIVW